MKEQVSIKVNIADRIFPLKVSFDEEEIIRKAADAINEKVRLYIDQYGIKDKQAALSMCALEISTELLSIESKRDQEYAHLAERLMDIDLLLDEDV